MNIVNGGDTASCGITNTRDTGSLTINKIIDIDGDLTTTSDQTPAEGWTFDVNGTSTDTSNPSPAITDSKGVITLTPLKTGSYTIIETLKSGYDLIGASCGDNGRFNGEDRLTNVTLSTSTTCTFYNTPNGSIHGYKWSDTNNNGREDFQEPKLSGWTINLYQWNGEEYSTTPTASMETSPDTHFGWYWFDHLLPGKYKVCEAGKENWNQTYPSNKGCHEVTLPDQNSNGFEIMENSTNGPVYNFGNVELARVTVYKYYDKDQDGYNDRGEDLLSGWSINLSQEGKETKVTDSEGKAVFGYLTPGTYYLSETLKDGWNQSGIYCPSLDGDGRGEYEVNNRELSLNAGDSITCYFGNYTNPETTITKSNDATSDKAPGDSVNFSILIKVTKSMIKHLTVKDLLPEGFKFRVGSAHAYIIRNGVSTEIEGMTPPEYHSPGIWEIDAELQEGDEVKLVYTADISTTQDPGLYKDVVWARATSLGDTLHQSLAQGTLGAYFAGTDVNVVKSQTSDQSYGVEREEKKEVGAVLGATTSLPNTGAGNLWLLLTLASAITGTYLVITSKKRS